MQVVTRRAAPGRGPSSRLLLASVCILACVLLAPAAARRVVVFGATGRVGRLAVRDLLGRPGELDVRCIVRSIDKAKETLPKDARVELVQGNLEREGEIEGYLAGADAVVWAASGLTDGSTKLDQVLGALKLKFSPASVIDIKALQKVGKVMSQREGVVSGGPAIVVCSSAGVTRPTWSPEKKQRMAGAADIPIVRLNPLNVLGTKRQGEESLRSVANGRYCIVRPCGLNDKTAEGRPLLSQGDVAVGRISRLDAAKLLCDCLHEPASCGRTFEALALPGFPYPTSLADQLTRLKRDAEPGLDENALFATYSLLQQIVPGTTLRPNELAMGQTYEQLDKKETGRLGERGSEQAPITRS